MPKLTKSEGVQARLRLAVEIARLFPSHADRIKEDMIYGAPDLVMEIISSGTEETDRQEKFDEYERAGVSEYWIVDPKRATVTVYALSEGAYKPQGLFGSGEVARSTLLQGFKIPVDELFSSQFTRR